MFIAISVLLLILFVVLAITKGRVSFGDTTIQPPSSIKYFVLFLALCSMSVGMFNKILFYAEPSFAYHIRTITGEESMVAGETGYRPHWFGRYTAWKIATSIKASDVSVGQTDADGRAQSSHASVNLGPQKITFLDQVDALGSATVRFRIPIDETNFFNMVHEFRTPENLMNAELVPAFLETIQATGSLMGAEEYYSGGRTSFNSEFEQQMREGIYNVIRSQKEIEDPTVNITTAPVSDSTTPVSSNKKIVFEVSKLKNSDGSYRIKKQSFTAFGIQVVNARMTDMVPNEAFGQRMQLKQQASADRAIGRERRIQEQEQKLLVIAEGERRVEERKAIALQEQIEQTTNALTQKQLAITRALALEEQAEIDKRSAILRKEKAGIDADARTLAADAEAYEKTALMKADNALQAKLTAEIEIQKHWAQAYATRKVPQYVFGGGSNAPAGGDGEVADFMKLMTINAAERLNYDRAVKTE